MHLIWTLIVPVSILSVLFVRFVSTNFVATWQFSPDHLHWIILCLGLLPINMFLEAYKWYILTVESEKTTVWHCAKIILIGRSLDVIAPFGLGDAVARVAYFHKTSRKFAIGLLAIANGTQMLPTLFFGLFSVVFLGINGFEISIYLFLGLFLFIFALATLFWILCRSPWTARLKIGEYLVAFQQLHWSVLFNSLTISVLRYGIFSCQFLFVLLWLDSKDDIITMIMGIFWIFLIKSILPSVSVFGDLAKRQLSAVAFFSFFGSDMELVLLANLVIWIVNMVLPALIGLFFVHNLRERII